MPKHPLSRGKIVVIAGPTATGKSQAAVKVAEAVNGEIVNADSVQVYRYFDIGSAKPSAEMRRAIPHHLLDIVTPDGHFTLWDYKTAANRAIADIAGRGKTPILCGGTGLYIKAVAEDLSGGAQPDADLRAELSRTPPDELYSRLKALDPARAARLHPNDTYRIIRGIENALLPGKDALPREPLHETAYFVLEAPRSVLYERIGSRVERMFAAGWIAEVESLRARGFGDACKPRKSVGYRQIMSFLAGSLPEGDLAEEVKKATRNYAKRQCTWFSAVKDAIRIDAGSGDPDDAARLIAGHPAVAR